MDREPNTDIEAIFLDACIRPSAERAAFLDSACAGDDALRSEVESLLKADSSAGDFLETPACELLGPLGLRGAPTPAIEPGRRLGAYEIECTIATGGMGVIYRARQERPQRVVALKLMRPGIASNRALRRFQHEAETLGRLSHPNIAQVYEAATVDEQGVQTPYFAMEFVEDAEHILAFARGRDLTIAKRLALFCGACDAVQHGHQRGVIHRDLKPANILVDAEGRVKIIDFGVARVTDSDVALTTLHTDVGQLVGTLQYMSPEQCGADPLDVDTRSDVYSLGIVLYELLCGQPPYDISGLTVPQAMGVIRETPPAGPSAHRPGLRGDLETILLRAIEKERGQRYASSSELAADLRRYLDSQPIEARPPSAAYQLRKFAARNRPLVVGVGIAAIGLLLGAIGAAQQAFQATADRQRAELAEQQAERKATSLQRIVDFQREMLAAAAPTDADGDVTVREVLDDAASIAGESLGDEPEAEAAIRDMLGQSYWQLGAIEQAHEQYVRALELRRRVLGDKHPQTLNTIANLAMVYVDRGDFAAAEPLLRETLAHQQATIGADHRDALRTMINLGGNLYHQRRFDDAVALLHEALDLSRAALGTESPETLSAMNTLAVIHGKRGEYENAEPLLSEYYEVSRRTNGPEHPTTLTAMNNLARLNEMLERFDVAEELLRAALQLRAEVLGADHPATLSTTHNLGMLLRRLERWDEAESLLRDALSRREEKLGASHPDTTSSMRGLSELLMEHGRAAEAQPLLTQVHANALERWPETDVRVAIAAGALGDCFLALGHHAEAEQFLVTRADVLREVLGEDNPRTAAAIEAVNKLRAAQRADDGAPVHHNQP